MIVALVLAAVAAICAGMALQYTWVFYSSVRRRHRKHFVGVSLFGSSDAIIGLNDADVYAAWSLARTNLVVAVVCLCAAAAISVGLPT